MHTPSDHLTSEIVAVRPDGSGYRVISSGHLDGAPAWSPDGSWLVFSRHVGSDSRLFVMKADGTSVAAITSHVGDDASPSWTLR